MNEFARSALVVKVYAIGDAIVRGLPSAGLGEAGGAKVASIASRVHTVIDHLVAFCEKRTTEPYDGGNGEMNDFHAKNLVIGELVGYVAELEATPATPGTFQEKSITHTVYIVKKLLDLLGGRDFVLA